MAQDATFKALVAMYGEAKAKSILQGEIGGSGRMREYIETFGGGEAGIVQVADEYFAAFIGHGSKSQGKGKAPVADTSVRRLHLCRTAEKGWRVTSLQFDPAMLGNIKAALAKVSK